MMYDEELRNEVVQLLEKKSLKWGIWIAGYGCLIGGERENEDRLFLGEGLEAIDTATTREILIMC